MGHKRAQRFNTPPVSHKSPGGHSPRLSPRMAPQQGPKVATPKAHPQTPTRSSTGGGPRLSSNGGKGSSAPGTPKHGNRQPSPARGSMPLLPAAVTTEGKHPAATPTVRPAANNVGSGHHQQQRPAGAVVGQGKKHKQGGKGPNANHGNGRPSSSFREPEEKVPKLAPPKDLPVMEAKSEVVQMVCASKAVILVSETGSGKTTQVPQFLLDEVLPNMVKSMEMDGEEDGANPHHHQRRRPMVGVTQPRRVAAMSVAQYVANLRGCCLGREVGYTVRFSDKTSKATQLKFMTDGILLKELLADEMLPQYNILVLDEAHERTLHGDLLFGLLKRLLRKRPHDLRIVIMSATLNTDHFSKFWEDAPVGYITGRQFPVSIYHTTEPQVDVIDAAINTILQIHTDAGEAEGDILCFLTGQEEIEDCREVLESRRKLLAQTDKDYAVRTLYAAMAPEQQMKVFDPTPNAERKIILSTNIAETSLTIEGIVYVVDTGLHKARQYNSNTGMEMLLEVPVAKAQARQRSGRAGRVRAGHCYRLYTADAFESLDENPVPEILRCSLESVVLQMKAMGIDDVATFDFMDKPKPAAIIRAMERLYKLGALDSDVRITKMGRVLADFPVDPMAAKTIVKSYELNVAEEVCSIIAMLSTENVQFTGAKAREERRKEGAAATMSQAGDHITALNIYRSFNSQPVKQKKEWCDSNHINFRQMNKVKDTMQQLLDLVEKHCGGGAVNVAGGSKRGREEASSPLLMEGTMDADENAIYQTEDTPARGSDARAAAGRRSGVMDDFATIRKAFCWGYFLQAAYFNAKYASYYTCGTNHKVDVHPSSVFQNARKKPALVLYNSLVKTTKHYLRDVMVIKQEWLCEAAPEMFRSSSNNAQL